MYNNIKYIYKCSYILCIYLYKSNNVIIKINCNCVWYFYYMIMLFTFSFFMMQDIKKWEDKIKQKRLNTPFRDYIREIVSWVPFNMYRFDNKMSRYPKSDRISKILPIKDYEEERLRFDEYGIDYDFNIPFFDNIKKLFSTVPYPARMMDLNAENSQFAEAVWKSHNIYLSFLVINDCENILYSFYAQDNVCNVLNSTFVWDGCDNVYQSTWVIKWYNIFYSKYIVNCSDVWFSSNLIGCKECLFCDDL